MFGRPWSLDTAAGFTVWRSGTVLACILGAWAILATTRITRGQEEAGRWDLLLSGRVPLPAVLVRHFAVIAAVPLASGTAVAAVLSAWSPSNSAGALIHGTGLICLGLFAAATGALTAQIFPTRAAASGVAVAVLGTALLARMVASGIDALAWLLWLSPFGLLEISAPYERNRPLPLMLLTAATIALYLAALRAAASRDVGSGLLSAPAGHPPRLQLLTSVEAFAVRRLLAPLAAWTAGVGAYFLLVGLTITSLTDFLADNQAFANAAAQAGYSGLETADGLTATLFALLALPVSAFTAARLAAFTTAESHRHLTLLAAGPTSRLRMLGAEAAATTAGVVTLLAVAAVSMWFGVTVTGGRYSLAAAISGTYNMLPIVLLSLGAGLLAVGLAPTTVMLAGSIPATGGYLLKVIADSTGAPAWITAISPYTHLAAVPLAGVNWSGAVVMAGAAGMLGAAGARAYQRRDLAG
ncbi:hypothetical protein [Kineosporia sp. NBRC 101731]|uniref:hypothetical protein n=1 Tax=Kineosporia sp. NBRC 101731 TaxID=3032199 RepID=UPI002554C2A5|nr:hypothetical protein [Kineosporia sp. NBRC 101731]